MSAESIPENMIDMITYELLEDPVIAEDNHVYSRNSLLDWFDGCTEVGEAITSPLTGRPMGTSMKPEPNIARQVEQFKARGGKSLRFNESTQTIGTLAKIFEIIDPLRDLFATKNWQAPALVVMGNENSGKSTLLERLAMMPIFPKDKFICTRMAIRVHLRRGPCMAPRLDVFDKQTGTVSRCLLVHTPSFCYFVRSLLLIATGHVEQDRAHGARTRVRQGSDGDCADPGVRWVDWRLQDEDVDSAHHRS
jgi:hypothetical protein